MILRENWMLWRCLCVCLWCNTYSRSQLSSGSGCAGVSSSVYRSCHSHEWENDLKFSNDDEEEEKGKKKLAWIFQYLTGVDINVSACQLAKADCEPKIFFASISDPQWNLSWYGCMDVHVCWNEKFCLKKS